jgi:subtilisin-like proprotein convertase family protein
VVVAAAMLLGGLQLGTGTAVAAPVCNPAQISINIPPQPMSAVLTSTPYPSTINITGLTGTITDVDIVLNDVGHPFPEDLDVLLVAPDGTNLLLMSDTGGNNQTSNLVSGIDLTLSDEAAGSIPTDITLVSGTYKPTDDDDDPDEFLGDHSESFPAPSPAPSANTALSAFDGKAPNGTWSLYVVDDDPGPPTPAPMGILGGWCITITSAGPARPAVADFDGNRTTDVSVFRPSAGQWLIRNQPTVFLGTATDIPVPCDYNGDGTTDAAVYRPAVGGWYINGQTTQFVGLDTDVPVPGDYDGDGDCDVAVFRPSVGGWYRAGAAPVFLGATGDIPVPGDYDGNGTTDVAVFRPAVGGWYRAGVSPVFFGLNNDVPVPGDYDGNGSTNIAIFRPSGGGWYVAGGATTFFGLSGDVPVPGDYDGNGTTDTAVYRPTGVWHLPGQSPIFFGTGTDIPLPLPAAIYRARFAP